MAKNIIFCADGTWNGPGQKDESGTLVHSNVQKLFESLAGSKALAADDAEMECSYKDAGGNVTQVAKYIHGVGYSGNLLIKFAEGSTGSGLVARLVRGYTYISRMYEPGDRIFLIGFSRGAYTVRALAGLIANKGLLDWKAMQFQAGTSGSYSAGISTWHDYQQARHKNSREILHHLVDFINDASTAFSTLFHPLPSLKYVPDVPIVAIGVWDTVGALGVPNYQFEDDTRLDVFEFIDTQLHPSVQYGFHAIAIDEQRVDFTPSIWDDRDGAGITQVLFPGSHADVGGGYTSANNQSGLSDATLRWMVNAMSQVGMQFGDMVKHSPLATGVGHQPWLKTPYDILPTALRHFRPGHFLSHVAIERVQASLVPIEKAPDAPYRPANLLNSYIMLGTFQPAPHVKTVPL